ncbi:DUF6274 family protein [Streptomyces zingiberis]|uniref:Uncharacterized protein n=1 Tax=Streptomyces zingiberis TaxID=2053010 RepID=A0ABX1C127_9ACTN|nr:DUF6274 family protein [Streptomyces zingiberis]NJQ03561.1 hypothetical protein [Streptomyces zingiberis]
MTRSAKHETGALLRAHLAAAARYRHLTGRCPVCRRLEALAREEPAEGRKPQYRTAVETDKDTAV